MTVAKRLFDLTFAVILSGLLMPVLAGIALWLRVAQGRGVFYASERVGLGGRPFTIWKFRTMVPAAEDSGASGGHQARRITAPGRVLRRTRLDELPQLWNILRGDMSFVGPRPPLRTYVERFPELYGQVLQSRPGVTGLATLVFHSYEARLLAGCVKAAETDALYARRCVLRKARLDLIYADHASLCFDLVLMGRTLIRMAME
ncbi:MAG: sugar transferase [Dinoroseobacter sp.]|nr:sugar transferase [Dinoroseobacter sp.]